MFCYVYLLRSEMSNNWYVGFTNDLRKRLTEHNNGLNRSIAHGKPWVFEYYEAHRNETDARRRENYLKTSAGHQTLRRTLREQLSRRDSSRQKVYY